VVEQAAGFGIVQGDGGVVPCPQHFVWQDNEEAAGAVAQARGREVGAHAVAAGVGDRHAVQLNDDRGARTGGVGAPAPAFDDAVGVDPVQAADASGGRRLQPGLVREVAGVGVHVGRLGIKGAMNAARSPPGKRYEATPDAAAAARSVG
jgi:hypothetical protein